ncbi:MAG: Crp/Fnr family transcriptional regulator [Bryobacteraceae bacterium]|nr:Crp/Fnr family transcriptional regulator [Bryobacteraceae bacterium]
MHPIRVPNFAALIKEQLLPMEGVTRIIQCRRFTILYSTGNAADSVFFLESGLVKIVKHGPENKEVLLNLVRPGEIFGEEALLLGGARNSIAEIIQEASIAIIPKDIFFRFCNRSPDTWKLMAELLARREQDLEQKIELLLMRDVEHRILFYLAELAEAVGVKQPNEEGYTIHFSQGEIASLVGATRETTSSTLNALARRGLVTLGRRRLIVSSPGSLRDAADGPKAKSATTKP